MNNKSIVFFLSSLIISSYLTASQKNLITKHENVWKQPSSSKSVVTHEPLIKIAKYTQYTDHASKKRYEKFLCFGYHPESSLAQIIKDENQAKEIEYSIAESGSGNNAKLITSEEFQAVQERYESDTNRGKELEEIDEQLKQLKDKKHQIFASLRDTK